MAAADSPRQGVTARTLAVLDAFDEGHARLTLSGISRRSGLPLTTTHRIVSDLVELDVLERRPDGAYVVGRRMWRLGLLAPVQHELRDVALPAMQDLHGTTGENVHLAVREGTEALYVERLWGTRSVRIVSRTGSRLPLHATGVGKVLLAAAPADVVDVVLGRLTPMTPRTVTDPGRLRRELAETLRRGYAKTVEEMTLGSWSVAVPVPDGTGEVVAALGVVSSTRRDAVRQLVPALQVTAARITRGLQPFP